MKKTLLRIIAVTVLMINLASIANAADISIELSVSPPDYEANSWVYIDVTIRNTGNALAEELVVQRVGSVWDRQNVGNLMAGESRTVQFTHKVTADQAEKASFEVIDRDGYSIAYKTVDLAPVTPISPEPTTTPESTTEESLPEQDTDDDWWTTPTDSNDDWWTAPTDSNDDWNTAPTDNNDEWWNTPVENNNDEWWNTPVENNNDEWWNTIPEDNSGSGTVAGEEENGIIEDIDEIQTAVQNIRVFGTQFIMPGKAPDFPEETIYFYPALPGRGDFLQVNTVYSPVGEKYGENVDGIGTDGLITTGANGSGVNGGGSVTTGTNNSGMNSSGGVNSSGGNNELSVISAKAPETGQGVNITFWVILSSISAIVLVVYRYIKKSSQNLINQTRTV